ncbi:MAG: Type 4 prepilin-like proteins leader peptide-processing enzyme [Steroidobacteraceae bacterium]|nr:Type 4 prepilin-like proteins leader peptide-processing enzyme [Steroidobacteraceae bacterium]
MIAACFVLGLLIGSFLNVVVHRTPVILDRQWRRQCDELAGRETPEAPRFNLVVPRSACPACKAPIKAWHNVPVLSWLALRGRCASCKAKISVRYPFVELLTGVLSAAVAWRFGAGPTALPALGAALALTWFLIALTFIDLDTQLLPDALTLPLLWLGLAASVLGYTAAGPREAIIGALAGYLSLWSVYHLFRVATGKEGMGYGDFKLLAALGAWLGWQMLLPIILLSAAVGAVTGIALIVLRGRDRNVPIPFGPFLAAAGWIALMWGPELVNGYLGMFAPGR